MDFYIFRHGETDYNVNKRMQGWLDIPLNDNGIAQAKALAEKLHDVKFDCIYSSSLSRALGTAKIVSRDTNTKIITNNELKEWNLGEFSGKIVRLTDNPADTPLDLSNDIVYVPKALISDDDYVPPNGESHNMFSKRVCDTMIKIAKNTNAETIGISTHGGVIKSLIKKFTDFKYPRSGVPNAEYIKMKWDGQTFTLPEPPIWLLMQSNSYTGGY